MGQARLGQVPVDLAVPAAERHRGIRAGPQHRQRDHMANPSPLGRVDGVAFLLGLVRAGRRQQEQVVAAGHGRVQGVGLLESAHGGLHTQTLDRGGLLGRAHQGPDGRARLGEQPHQLRAGGAGGTGDQDHGLLHTVRQFSRVSPTSPAADANTYPREASQPRPCSTHPSQVRQPDAARTRTRQISRGRTMRPSNTNCWRWPSTTGPNPRLRTRPAGPTNAGGRRCPLGLDLPATPPGRRPGPQER